MNNKTKTYNPYVLPPSVISALKNPIINASNVTTNLEALIFILKLKQYFNGIQTSSYLAGQYLDSGKLYFFTFVDLNTWKRYNLSAYEIMYSLRQMYLYNTPEAFYNDSFVRGHMSAYMNRYEILKEKNYVYQQYYYYYQFSIYASIVYKNVALSLYYKSLGDKYAMVFKVLQKFFPNVPENQIKKAYSNLEIYELYRYILA